MERHNLSAIKKTVEDFFSKMTFSVLSVDIDFGKDEKESVDIFVKIDEPQVLIGEKGQTLLEIQKMPLQK